MKTKAHIQTPDGAHLSPAKGEATTFWIRPANREGLRELSQATGTSVSYLINRAISRLLENPRALFLPDSHTDHTSAV
jgi:predicted DNA-binding protein